MLVFSLRRYQSFPVSLSLYQMFMMHGFMAATSEKGSGRPSLGQNAGTGTQYIRYGYMHEVTNVLFSN